MGNVETQIFRELSFSSRILRFILVGLILALTTVMARTCMTCQKPLKGAPGNRWTLKTPPDPPPMRGGDAMAFVGKHVVLFGGSWNDVFFNDTWVWDGNN